MSFTSARSITERVNPPRSVFVDLPKGHTTGVPGDHEGQRALLTEGLTQAHAMQEPGTIVDLPYRYVDDDWKTAPLAWSRRRQDGEAVPQPGGDNRSDRSTEPKYQTDADRAAAEAVDWDQQCQVCVGIEPRRDDEG